jgi:hypothetical protein
MSEVKYKINVHFVGVFFMIDDPLFDNSRQELTRQRVPSNMAHKTMDGDCINNNVADGSFRERGCILLGGGCMKCIRGVGFICFGVNINGDCFYEKKRGGGACSVNLKGS